MFNENWKKMKIKDFIEFNPKESIPKGKTAKKVSMKDIIPNTKEIYNYNLKKYKGGPKFKNGDTLMARITPCLENGKISQVNFLDDEEVGFGSTEFIVFRERKGISDKDFVYYLVNSDFFKNTAIKSMIGSSGRQRVQNDVLKDLIVRVPNLNTQKKIGKLLSILDEKISINKKINQNLLKISNCIYLRINEKYSNKLIQYKLSDISKIKYGKNLPIINLKNEGYPVYGGNGIIGYYGEYIYKTSQILVSCRGEASGKVLFSKPHSFITNNSLVLECERKYYYFLKEFSLLNEFYECVTGSAQPQITIKNIKNIPIKIPNDEILNKYNKVFEIIESYYFENLTEIDMLKRLRDTLLPKLIFGEIDVSEIEI